MAYQLSVDAYLNDKHYDIKTNDKAVVAGIAKMYDLLTRGFDTNPLPLSITLNGKEIVIDDSEYHLLSGGDNFIYWRPYAQTWISYIQQLSAMNHNSFTEIDVQKISTNYSVIIPIYKNSQEIVGYNALVFYNKLFLRGILSVLAWCQLDSREYLLYLHEGDKLSEMY